MCGSVVSAQQRDKVQKIGWIRSGSASRTTELFQQELRRLGYTVGKNLVIEERSAENDLARLPALAEELVHLKVDVLVATSTAAALAAKNVTRTTPIVIIGITDPVGAGLVDNLPRPGGNITGFTTIGGVLAGKRLELLKETVPRISRVAFLWNPRDLSSVQQWKESLQPARELGLQLYSLEVSSADKLGPASKMALKAQIDALAIPQDPLAASNQRQIVKVAEKHRLPAIYSRSDFVESGGLMSYGPDRNEPYMRGAAMVHKILKGAKPADLPVEQPSKFEFVVNLKTAKQIGLTIPPNVLARADRVIK